MESRVAISTFNSTIQPFSYAFGSNVQKQVVILILNCIRVHSVTSVTTILAAEQSVARRLLWDLSKELLPTTGFFRNICCHPHFMHKQTLHKQKSQKTQENKNGKAIPTWQKMWETSLIKWLEEESMWKVTLLMQTDKSPKGIGSIVCNWAKGKT